MNKGSTGLGHSATQGQPGHAYGVNWLEPLKEVVASPLCRPLGLCKGYGARMSRERRTFGCCLMAPTPCTSWTARSNATSWALWTSPPPTGSASDWSTCGRRCATPTGPSPPSARLSTPVASASGWRRTPSDRRGAALSPSGQWAQAWNACTSLVGLP